MSDIRDVLLDKSFSLKLSSLHSLDDIGAKREIEVRFTVRKRAGSPFFEVTSRFYQPDFTRGWHSQIVQLKEEHVSCTGCDEYSNNLDSVLVDMAALLLANREV